MIGERIFNMPSYIYKAKKDAVNSITGQISAQNEEDALEIIHQLGLIPVSIEESNAGFRNPNS